MKTPQAQGVYISLCLAHLLVLAPPAKQNIFLSLQQSFVSASCEAKKGLVKRTQVVLGRNTFPHWEKKWCSGLTVQDAC